MEDYPEDIPKTSAPNTYDWLTVLEERYDEGYRKFIVTTISSKLSSSFETAIAAKRIMEEKRNDVQIEVICSNTCACGQAVLEMGLGEMIESGKKFEEIIDDFHKMIGHASSIFVVNSLTYMKAGGRIGGATAFLGKIINIKPVCEFVGGEVHTIKAAMGRKKSLKVMIDTAVSRINDINKTIVIIENAKCQDDSDYICNYFMEKTKNCCKIFKSNLGITVGAHSGPGAIGIGLVEKP
jgi:DegV family protein with EDD domain